MTQGTSRALADSIADEGRDHDRRPRAKVKDVIEHRVALRLVIETVKGMAKTAPMTDEAYKRVAGDAARSASPASSVPRQYGGWRRLLPWGRRNA